jgi:hypothetical protein
MCTEGGVCVGLGFICFSLAGIMGVASAHTQGWTPALTPAEILIIIGVKYVVPSLPASLPGRLSSIIHPSLTWDLPT